MVPGMYRHNHHCVLQPLAMWVGFFLFGLFFSIVGHPFFPRGGPLWDMSITDVPQYSYLKLSRRVILSSLSTKFSHLKDLRLYPSQTSSEASEYFLLWSMSLNIDAQGFISRLSKAGLHWQHKSILHHQCTTEPCLLAEAVTTKKFQSIRFMFFIVLNILCPSDSG